MPSDLNFRRISRISAPGTIMTSGFSTLHDQEDLDDTSTDENEFSYTGEEVINETDV